VSDKTYAQHLAKGGELLRADRVEEARAELEQALALKAGDGKILNLLGLCYFRLGQYGDAMTIYVDLVGRTPNDPSLRLNLGLVHLKIGKVEDAISELEKARELDPSQQRTIGYLGLAYARKGEYAKAKEAFLKAGQEELAREMEQYLTGAASAGGNGAQAAAQASAPQQAQGVPQAVAPDLSGGFDQAEQRTRIDPDAIARARATVPASEDGAPTPIAVNEGIVTAAVRVANLPLPTATVAEGHRAPEPLSSFGTARLIRPDDSDLPFELAAGDTLIVRVRGRILSRTEGVIVSGGELAYEPAGKRVRGRMTEEPFGTEDRPMFFVSGQGHLIATPRGGKFTALQLSDDILYVREDLVFAFEEHLRWENGNVPGSAGNINVLQFRGEGCVAIRTRRAPLTVKLAPDKTLYVDSEVLAGWMGRVVPRIVAPAAGGDASAPFVECTGEGIVLVEEPDTNYHHGLGDGHSHPQTAPTTS
jgi:Flp pilus assembly protein TadD/uncharacterized protein (AIM24 family)